MSGNKLVTVAAFYTNIEAHLARGKLENHGIEVTLQNERLINATGFYYLFGGIKLQVYEKDAAEAKRILDEVAREE